MALIKFPAFGTLGATLHTAVEHAKSAGEASVIPAWAPKAEALARPTRGLEALASLDLGVGLSDINEMRIVLTDAAKPATIERVGQETRRLVKLDKELSDALPGAETAQLEAEMRKVAKALTSRLAGQKGVFLSKNDARVDLVSPETAARATGAAADDAQSAGRRSAKVATAAAVAVDPITGERVVLQPMGRVVEDLPLSRFAEVHGERSDRGPAAKILATDKVAVKNLRTLSDAELDKAELRRPDGPIEYVTLNGAEGTEQTFTYPTRWFKKPNELAARRMVIEGPFRGSYLDDVASRVDELSLSKATQESRLLWLSPKKSNLQPIISTVQVREAGEVKTKLRVRVPSTPEWTAVRQSIAQMANSLPDVMKVEDSKSTLFMFEPTDFGFIRKVAPAFGRTKEAQQLVDGHVNELLKFEKALTPEALRKFSARAIGGFRETFLDGENRIRPFELSQRQREALALLELDGWRGSITLPTGQGKTVVAMTALELLAKQGEQRPFLVVVPKGLEGNFTSEVFINRKPEEAQRLIDRVKVMTYEQFRRAVRKGELDGQPFDKSRFGAAVFDEAHVASDRRSATGAAVLKFGHEHTFEMTGTPEAQPERLQTMDAGVRGIDLNSPAAKAERRKARKWREFLFTEVNGITTGVKGPFELRRGLKIDPTYEMLQWIRTRFIYGDDLKADFTLPKRTDVPITLPMSGALETAYRAAAEPLSRGLEGLVSIYRDKGLVDPNEPGTAGRPKLTPQARDPRVRDVFTKLKAPLAQLAALTNTEEKLTKVGDKLFTKRHEDKVGGLPDSRALLFSEDASYVRESARVMSLRMPTLLHAACLPDRIEIYQNGQPLGSIGPHDLPFTAKKAYRADPLSPVNSTTNREVPAAQWRTFALNVLGKHPEVATTTLFGPTYQTGQNLQWANTVVHLDRATVDKTRPASSDYNMHQREARSLRRGQTSPVTVMSVDYVYDKPRSTLDRTLDQVRELQALNERGLMEQTLLAAQKIKLGEGMERARASTSFDDNAPLPSLHDFMSLMLAASPTPANVGLAKALP